MRMLQSALALSVGLLAVSPVAAAVAPPPAVTLTFTESAQEGGFNPTPGVQGYTGQFAALGGPVSSVTLFSYFSEAPSSFSYTYSLLEPGSEDQDVSDQVTFAGGGLLGTSLFVLFTSDPLSLVPTSCPVVAVAVVSCPAYGSTLETGNSQTIPLPANMPTSRYALSVFATSELEGAVPEPATWAMMLLGFGGIGMAMRRRRKGGRLLQAA